MAVVAVTDPLGDAPADIEDYLVKLALQQPNHTGRKSDVALVVACDHALGTGQGRGGHEVTPWLMSRGLRLALLTRILELASFSKNAQLDLAAGRQKGWQDGG